MNKAILAVGAMLMLGGSMQVNADTKICVFDLLGKSGEAYKAMEEWALAAKTWRSASLYWVIKMKLRPRMISSRANVMAYT